MKQSGNVLFLILIAVALFAALSYAVTQSGRGGGNITRETNNLVSSRISQWYSEAQYAFQKMALLNGVDAHDVLVSNGVNNFTPCSAGNNCLWSADGGQVTLPPNTLSDIISNPAVLRDNTVASTNVTWLNNEIFAVFYMGTSAEDLALCQAYQTFIGESTTIGGTVSAYPDQYSGCFMHSSGNYALYFIFYGETP